MSLLDRLKRLLGARPEPNGAGEMISCHDALGVLQDYLDGELDDFPTERVRQHFEVCSRCYPHLRLEESFRAAVRKATQGESAPPALRARVLELLENAEKDAGPH